MSNEELRELTMQLSKIVIELDARASSCNFIYEEFDSASWDDLCDMAIDIVERLKEI